MLRENSRRKPQPSGASGVVSGNHWSGALPQDGDTTIALVLAGGVSLGAYQGGAYAALSQAGLEPHWIAGGSAGAVNGAIILGNAPEVRVERLREFWDGLATPTLALAQTGRGDMRTTGSAS
jgi:NTE family protein